MCHLLGISSKPNNGSFENVKALLGETGGKQPTAGQKATRLWAWLTLAAVFTGAGSLSSDDANGNENVI